MFVVAVKVTTFVVCAIAIVLVASVYLGIDPGSLSAEMPSRWKTLACLRCVGTLNTQQEKERSDFHPTKSLRLEYQRVPFSIFVSPPI
jgi:hypothetical protein